MPWIKAPKDESQPARYDWPLALPDCVVLGHAPIMEFAINQRKEVGQIREGLIVVQKAIGRDDREGARALSEFSADLLKQFRGWDSAIKMINGDEGYHDWRRQKIQEEIAPYVDKAFAFMDLFTAQPPQQPNADKE